MKVLRKLYNWVLSLSERPNSFKSLSILSFSEASFFPIPPDVLLIPLCLGSKKKAFYFALICSISSFFGAVFGYYIGKLLWWNIPELEYSSIANMFFDYIPGITVDGFNKIKTLYSKWDFWIVFTAGFTPIPFKLITISAGTFNINLIMFMIASLISRSCRFFIVAFLIKIFGDPIKVFIEKYFNILSFLFMILFIGGFIIVKYFIS